MAGSATPTSSAGHPSLGAKPAHALTFNPDHSMGAGHHANKKGLRYRYYVSQAVLQKRKDEAGSIARVAAPDIEELVIAALRHQIGDVNRKVLPVSTSPPPELSDRDLVALHVERIVLRSRRIDITLRSRASPEGQGAADPSSRASITLHLPWTSTSASARKGIAACRQVHSAMCQPSAIARGGGRAIRLS